MHTLLQVYEGWDGYQTSLLHAITPLTPEQLTWRAARGRRTIGETIRHISLGRIDWFRRMGAPGAEEAAQNIKEWATDDDGVRHIIQSSVPAEDAAELAGWLERSWEPVRRVLNDWTVEDLAQTYRHRYCGTDYLVSRQWTIWRIMAHDLHHGGQVAMMLALQGIEAPELRGLGGHIIEPPKAQD